MSMGFSPNMVEVIEDAKLAEVCPETLEAFRAALLADAEVREEVEVAAEDPQDSDGYLREAKRYVAWQYTMRENEDAMPADLLAAYRALQVDFENETGLRLSLCFHDSENDGSNCDEVSGPYWAVDGMYQLTPAGRRARERGLVETKGYVSFG